MKIFLVPGLGYDHRIFDRLTISVGQAVPIAWIDPIRGEKIADYAARLFASLPPEDEDVVLIGHSFGGVVSQEIATQRRISKVILISSIQERKEMSRSMRWVKPLGLYRLFTRGICLRTVKYWGAAHGFPTKEDQELFKSMVGKCSNRYLQWALRTLSGWHAPVVPVRTKVFRIHGGKDKTFPAKYINPVDALVEFGNHILLYDQAERVSELLELALAED